MPRTGREVTTVGGRRINQRQRRSNKETIFSHSDHPPRQEVDSEEDAHSETADDILARSPPADLPEYISRTTEKSKMFWAPLISGSTQEEKDLMDQELATAGNFQFPERHHPQYVDTRINDPGNLNRLLFYEGQDPNARLILAGVPNTPLNLDPPGTDSPFDALKHPKSLIARLNRLPEDPDGLPYGWDEEALKKIPYSIIAKLPLKTLNALPESVRINLPTELLARDPEDPPAPPILPVIGRLTHRSQRVSNEDEDMPNINNLRAIRRYGLQNQRTPTDEEEIRDTPELPGVSRSARGRQRMTMHNEQTPETNDMPEPEEIDLPKLPAYVYPGIDEVKRAFQRGLATHQPSPLPQPSSQPPAPRRRGKIRHACDNCRSKKLKCDGIHPSCNTCGTSGVQCSYGGGTTQGGGGQTLLSEEQPEEQIQGPGPGPESPAQWRWDQTLYRPGEQPTTIAAADPGRAVPPLTNVQIEDRGFETTADHETISTDLNLGVDRIVLAAVRGPFGYQLGVTPELAGHFIRKSKTDHLSLQEDTTIPLKFHPKPVLTQMPNFSKNVRARTVEAYTEIRFPQEETFMARPSVRIVVPDHLKNLLVDDWENVTKSLLVVPLPSKAPVNFIIDSYFDEEKGKRRLGSAEADVLEEFVAGMKVYFDKAIGKTLLYKFERPQWAEVCKRSNRSHMCYILTLSALTDPTAVGEWKVPRVEWKGPW
jgi:MRG/Fungal Zn(2)-Cys(6) binuclear cluster domain